MPWSVLAPSHRAILASAPAPTAPTGPREVYKRKQHPFRRTIGGRLAARWRHIRGTVDAHWLRARLYSGGQSSSQRRYVIRSVYESIKLQLEPFETLQLAVVRLKPRVP